MATFDIRIQIDEYIVWIFLGFLFVFCVLKLINVVLRLIALRVQKRVENARHDLRYGNN